MAAHNSESTIAEALDSVVAQTYRHWEVIVIDDGSTDDTSDVVNDYISRGYEIRLIHQTQAGEAAARNAGIPFAQNDWLLFLDSDDWISAEHLQLMMGPLASNPDLDAVHCGSARVASNGVQVIEKYRAPAGDLFHVLGRRAAFPIHACIVRKSLVDRVGRFDGSLEKSPDWDLWQRIARTGAIFGSVDAVLAFYRMSPNAASLDAEKMLRDGLQVLRCGHSRDPRVTCAHPDHINGLDPAFLPAQKYYLLAWCAGLQISRGHDPLPLLKQLEGEFYERLYSDAIARCIFDAVPIASCLPPDSWQTLAGKLMPSIHHFLTALEAQSKTPGLAGDTSIELNQLILMQIPEWRPVIERLEQQICELEKIRLRLEEEKRQAYENSNRQQERLDLLQSERNQLESVAQDLERQRSNLNLQLESLRTSLNEKEQQLNHQSAKLLTLRKTIWVRLGKKLGLLPRGSNKQKSEKFESGKDQLSS
jgi:glycosyltransferase involved in cell wall biosynthesis